MRAALLAYTLILTGCASSSTVPYDMPWCTHVRVSEFSKTECTPNSLDLDTTDDDYPEEFTR